jgi:hypothetical protein
MRMKSGVAKGALVLASLGAGLLLAEGIWRLFIPRPGFAAHSELSAPGMVVPHPRRSYTLAPNWSGRMKGAEFDVGFRTDPLGCRIPSFEAGGCAGAGDPSSTAGETGGVIDDSPRPFTILALGDSFTFGHGLEAEQAWPAQLGRRLDSLRRARWVCIVNGAVSAYNMAQVRDRAEELAPGVAPDLVVLGLFVNGAERMKNPYVLYEGDVVRDNERSRLRAVDGGFLHTPFGRPRLQSLDFWLGEHFYVGAALLEQSYRTFEWASNAPGHYWRWMRRNDGPSGRAGGPTEAGERAYLAPLLEEVGRIDALARSLHGPLVVLVIHVQLEDGGFRPIDDRFSRYTAEYGAARGIPVFDPTPFFKERAHGAPVFRYSRGDAHWSASAQALAAEELAAFLERERLVPAPVSGG